MPYVIELEPDGLDRMFNKGSRKFYAGPMAMATSLMGLKPQRSSGTPVFDMLTLATPDINSATRMPVRGLMDDKAAELNRLNPAMGARVVYDEPLPLKMLKWLVTAPKPVS